MPYKDPKKTAEANKRWREKNKEILVLKWRLYARRHRSKVMKIARDERDNLRRKG